MPKELICSSQEDAASAHIEEMVALVDMRSAEYRRTNAFLVTPELRNWNAVMGLELTRVTPEDKKIAQEFITTLQEYRTKLVTRLPSLDSPESPATATERFIPFEAYTEFLTLDLQRVPFGGEAKAAHEDLKKLYDFIDSYPDRFLREPTPRDAQNYRIHVADFGGMIVSNVLYVCQNNVLQSILHQDGNYMSYIAERVEYAVDMRLLEPELAAQLCKALYSFPQYQPPQNEGQPDVPQDHAGRLHGQTRQAVGELLQADDPRFQMIHMTRYIHREPQAVTTFGHMSHALPQFDVGPQYLKDQTLGRRTRKEHPCA